VKLPDIFTNLVRDTKQMRWNIASVKISTYGS